MKLIEAMKKLKDLNVKAEELRKKISVHCAHLNFETPPYGESQKTAVESWLQSHSDLLKEILKLRIAIQRTNLATQVSIDLGSGAVVDKSIAEWIHRRRDLAKLEMAAWSVLTDRGLKEGTLKNSQDQLVDVRIVRYYDPKLRDVKVEAFRSEPNLIDATLEVVNATTELQV